MSRPTRVTIVTSDYIGVKVSGRDKLNDLIDLGFVKDDIDDSLLFFDAGDGRDLFLMLEKLRDMGIPFSTHRTGGADYAVETFREKGHLSGPFRRINFLGNDTDENAPYILEKF